MIKQHQPPFNVLLKDDKRNCEDHGNHQERSCRLFAHTPPFPSLFLSFSAIISSRTLISLSHETPTLRADERADYKIVRQFRD